MPLQVLHWLHEFQGSCWNNNRLSELLVCGLPDQLFSCQELCQHMEILRVQQGVGAVGLVLVQYLKGFGQLNGYNKLQIYCNCNRFDVQLCLVRATLFCCLLFCSMWLDGAVHWTCDCVVHWTCDCVVHWTCDCVVHWKCDCVEHWTCDGAVHWTCDCFVHWTCDCALDWTCDGVVHWTCDCAVHWTCDCAVDWTCDCVVHWTRDCAVDWTCDCVVHWICDCAVHWTCDCVVHWTCDCAVEWKCNKWRLLQSDTPRESALGLRQGLYIVSAIYSANKGLFARCQGHSCSH
jgi:hypothetical protein